MQGYVGIVRNTSGYGGFRVFEWALLGFSLDKAIGWVLVSKRGLLKAYLRLLLFLVVSVAVSWNDLSFWFEDELPQESPE